MAVAELPAHAIALPRHRSRVVNGSDVAPNLAWIPLVGVLLGIASLFYVAQTGEVAVAGYDIQQLQAEVEQWQMRNEQLSLQLAQAKSLPAVEAEARGRLLMVPARDPIFLKAAPTASVDIGGSVTSSRGPNPVAPALERPGKPAADPLDPVLSSVSVLIPRSQSPQR